MAFNGNVFPRWQIPLENVQQIPLRCEGGSVCSAWEVGSQMVRKHRNFSLPKHMLLVWLCSTSGVRNSYNYCYIKLPPTGFIMLLCSVWIRSLVQCWWLFLASEASAGRTWSLGVTGMAEVRVNKDDYCSDMASKSEMLRPSWGQVTLTLLGTYVDSLLTWVGRFWGSTQKEALDRECFMRTRGVRVKGLNGGFPLDLGRCKWEVESFPRDEKESY